MLHNLRLSKGLLKEKYTFPERSEQTCGSSSSRHKSMVPKIVSEHVTKTLSLDDPVTRSKGRNEIQDIRREKPSSADPVYRP